MKVEELRELLEESEDKLSVFADKDIIGKLDMTIGDFLDVVKDFLSDEEKYQLLNFEHFQTIKEYVKSRIISLIKNEEILIKILNDEKIGGILQTYQIIEIIKNFTDNGKKQILKNKPLLKRYKIGNYDIDSIIRSFSDAGKREILSDKKLIKDSLGISNYQLIMLLKELTNSDEDNVRLKMKVLLENEEMNTINIMELIASLPNEAIIVLFDKHRDFFATNKIYPYKVIRSLSIEQQLDFVKRIEETMLTKDEKKQILVTIDDDVKKSIDTSIFPEEYRSAIEIKTSKAGWIREDILNDERNLEEFRGLDVLIRIYPEELNEEQRARLIKLCEICPDMNLFNILNDEIEFRSTAKEYLEAEKWITELIEELNPEYNNAQKLAVIDNAIGKKISYSPDFDTEVFNNDTSRALWKIISSGYGVCNGIANLERYILQRVGIESEIISSGNHSFLRIKNIELPLANGEMKKGDTIVDPTWNLMFHRFGGRPDNFCINYEQIREHDIDSTGKDIECHKNDELLQDVTLYLDDESLRALFKSVGLADKDGMFPIKELTELSKSIDEMCKKELEENIIRQFLLLRKYCIDFASCQNSSMAIIKNVLLNNKNMKFNRCIVNRVYDRLDKERKAIMYVYIEADEFGRKFYYADKDRETFLELSPEEFIKRFECYDKDLEKEDGKRPWEIDSKQQKEESLQYSSGNVVAKEGEER